MRFGTYLFLVAITAAGAMLAFRHLRAHENPEWAWAYDASGRPIWLTTLGGKKTRIKYATNETGQVRRVEKHFDDGTQSRFELDEYGRVKRMIDQAGSTDYEYDGLDRVIVVRRAGLPSLSYQYDAFGKLKGYSIGDTWNVAYTYDFLDRIAKIDTPIGAIQYRYDSASRSTTRIFPNGVRTTWQYQADGQLRSMTHLGADDQILLKLTYSYRPDGLIDGVDEYSPSGTEQRNYEYDNSRRLISVLSSAHGRTSYRYDSLGHRVAEIGPVGKTTNVRYSWSETMSSINGNKVMSDAAGNMTRYVRDGNSISLTYGGTNEANSVSVATRKVRYVYDGDGVLVGRSLGRQTTSFLNDTLASYWQPLMSHDSSGKDTWYLWDKGVPLAIVKNGVPTFLLTDHLGLVRSVVTREGRIKETLDYDAFGSLTAEHPTDELSFGMAGLAFDSVAGLYLTRHRSYDPILGTFLQRDPMLSSPTSASDFAGHTYCDDDPINCRDLDGAQPGPPPYVNEIDPELLHQNIVLPPHIWGQQINVLELQAKPGVAFGLADAAKLVPGAEPFAAGLEAIGHVAGLDLAGYSVGEGLKFFKPSSAVELENIHALRKLTVGEWETSKVSVDPLQILGKVPFVQLELQATLHRTAVPFGEPGGTTIIIPQLQKDVGVTKPIVVSQGDSQTYLYNDYLKGPGNYYADTAQHGDAIKTNVENIQAETFARSGDDVNSGPLSASNVGGISLRGAADALRSLGVLIGVVVDNESGRLVLISEPGKVGLPPLRMDDPVTIFRSVYQQGESPWVTIDPNPANPKGPIMIVRQGAATAQTYVGWVLFEADRVMKVYSLGMDNLEQKHFVSQIPGYPDIMKLMFEPHGGGSVWERFWIVPAEIVRKHSSGHDLTIFDVPLKVNTQRMVLHDGKLIPAGQRSTRSADAFTKWFTEHYDEIANESRCVPPAQSEISSLVPVFEELRRVALISAIAEKLRGDGVPMPFWMEQYATHQVPFAQTTPAITAKSENKQVSIYGGVNLSPADDQIRDVQDSAEASAVVPLALKALRDSASFSVVTTPETGKLTAVALPGNDTKDFASGFLVETDLAVPTRAGELRLSRRFHSFFKPNGEFGVSWTLDLPYLETTRRPMHRRGDFTTFLTTYALRSPLATYDAAFVDRRFVPELNSELLVPAKPGDILGLAPITSYQYGAASEVIFFRDGQKLYFDRRGDLICWMKGPSAVLYRWSSERRLASMQALIGGSNAARIDLDFDNEGRIVVARDNLGRTVSYSYDAVGHLTSAARSDRHREYRYRDDLVVQVLESGKSIQSLAFDSHGHLTRRESAGVVTEYRVDRTSQGARVVSLVNGREANVAEYDTHQRPRFYKGADGTVSTWGWNPDGSTTIKMSSPREDPIQVRLSADRLRYELRTARGGQYIADLDEAGRPIGEFLGSALAFRAHWDSNGELTELETENSAIRAHYDPSGSLSELMFHEPSNNGAFRTWRSIQFADARPTSIEDSSGAHTEISYTESDKSKQVKMSDSGLTVMANGNTRAVHSSWGENAELQSEPDGGQPLLYRLSKAGAEMLVKYETGYPTTIRSFFGEVTSFEYESSGHNQKKLRAIHMPSGSALHYQYNKHGRLAEIECTNAYRLRYEYDEQERLTRVSQLPIAK